MPIKHWFKVKVKFEGLEKSQPEKFIIYNQCQFCSAMYFGLDAFGLTLFYCITDQNFKSLHKGHIMLLIPLC